MSLPHRRINEIVLGKRSITTDTALCLAAFFGTDAQSWMNLQTHYDIERASESVAKFLKTAAPVAREPSNRDVAHS